MGDQVSLSRVGWCGCRAGTGIDPAELYEPGHQDTERPREQGPCASAGVVSAEFESGQGDAVLEGALVEDAARRVLALEEAILGPTLVGARILLRYSGCSDGRVDP